MSIMGKDERVIDVLTAMLADKTITVDYVRFLLDERKIILEEFVEITKTN